MKSKPITQKDVYLACKEITETTLEQPSSARVRQILGRGSFSTIEKHLKEWRKTNPEYSELQVEIMIEQSKEQQKELESARQELHLARMELNRIRAFHPEIKALYVRW